MSDDDGAARESLELAERTLQLRRNELKAAAMAAHSQIRAAGYTSKKVTEATGYDAALFRRLVADGDKTGWRAPSPEYSEAIDALGRDRMGLDFGLTALRKKFDEASKLVAKLEADKRRQESRSDLVEARRDVFADHLHEYLQSLSRVLSATGPWIPFSNLDDGFEQRSVSASTTPPGPGEPGRLYDDSRPLPRGDISWRSAIQEVPLAVVLADAGFGKTWLLRHHAMQLCHDAMDSLASGADPQDIPIPLWMHADDLARAWPSEASPSYSVIEAGMKQVRVTGFAPSPGLRDLLTSRLAINAAPVHLLVDGYDEVVDHRLRVELMRALRWLGDLPRDSAGPRIVLASRPSGYMDPFDTRRPLDETEERPEPQYLSLGVLEDAQVRHSWDQWFAARHLPVPIDRLEPALAPGSPLRRFVRVPLIAAFCAWVAEEQPVIRTRTGLYGQVIARFLTQVWKQDEPSQTVSSPTDGVRRARFHRALVGLAWQMAAGDEHWRDALPIDECETALSNAGLTPHPDRSLTWEGVRQIGILIQPGSTAREIIGDSPISWIHRSVHEYLVAIRLVTLSEPDVREIIDTRMWFHLGWANVLDFALGLETDSDRQARTVIGSIGAQALTDHDALGWFTTILTSSEVSTLPDPDLYETAREQTRRLYNAGLLTAPHLARVLAMSPNVDTLEIVAVLTDALSSGTPRKEVWEALAWCGPHGREALAEMVRSSADAAGAANALLSVDPRAAVSAMSERIRAGLRTTVADAPVLRLMDDETVDLLIQEYLDQPTSLPRAKMVGWCRTQRGYAVLTSAETLRSSSAGVRCAAFEGLSAWYGFDLDRQGFELMVDIAINDPDPTMRVYARADLQATRLSVPWVSKALNELVFELHEDESQPELRTLESLAARLREIGPATQKVVIMLREQPKLLAGPVREAMLGLTSRALSGTLGAELTADIARLVGPDFSRLACDRLRSGELGDTDAYVRLAIGTTLADPTNEELFDAIVECAGNRPHVTFETALQLHGMAIRDRINTLLLTMSSLTSPAPAAVRVWANTVRKLLMELPHVGRLPHHEACASTTAHVLSLADD